MIGRLILTQGGLARELLSAAQTISGEMDGFEALSLDWHEPVEQAREKVQAAVQRLDQGQGVLILADMYGGTPCNVALSFLEVDKVEVLTGVNLPMVVRLTCPGLEELSLTELGRWLQAKGQRSVCLASDVAQQRCGTGAGVKVGCS
jgi:PTS system mannose-specific IIA component